VEGEGGPMNPPPDYGRMAYEAYLAQCGGKSLISGAPLPTYDAQKPEIQAAWEVAGKAVANHVVHSMDEYRRSRE
jgi:hypothetical protein